MKVFCSRLSGSAALLFLRCSKRIGDVSCHITSIAVREPGTPYLISSVFRAGVAALSKSLANELGHSGILVNTVCPGPFRTPLGEELIQQAAAAQKSNLCRNRIRNGSNLRYRSDGGGGGVGRACRLPMQRPRCEHHRTGDDSRMGERREGYFERPVLHQTIAPSTTD